jgi:microcystin-dependent protein
VYSVDIKSVDDDACGITISASQPNNFNSIGVAAYSKWTGFVFRFYGNTGSGNWNIHKNIDNIEYPNNFITIASGTASEWDRTKYHRFKAIAINNTIKFYITYDIDGTPSSEELLYTHYDTDNIILQGNRFGVYNRSNQNTIYKNIVLTEMKFTDEITLQGIDNTITIASNTISSDGNFHFTGNVHITGNLRLPHSAIENITYKSSTHIKNIIDINKVTENVVIKPTNTTSTSAVEIINTNNNNEFMTLNSGDSSDTTEQVRFNKSGVGIGTTNAENYALNVVGGNANCYGVYPVGSIIMFGGRNGSTNIPSGWLLCDGTNYTNDDYPMLASIIGTIYGGTTDTNFNVPNLTQRSGVGSADVAGINFSNNENLKNTDDKRGGNATLSTNQLASHSHNVDVNYSSSNWNNNIVKGTSGTSHSGGSGTFDKYFPFTYNYNSSNEEGVGRYAFNKSNYYGGGHEGLKTTNSISNTIKYHAQKSGSSDEAHYLHGVPLRHLGALINTESQTKATNTSGIVVGGNIVNTIEKAYNNAEVKYHYNVNSTRNQSNMDNATIGSTTQTGNTDFYPKATRIRYIIYSGVHNTTTYPWK